MIPTLLIGDHLYIDPRAYADRDPARGDIVVFNVARDGSRVLPRDKNPDLFAETFIKRIVGLPGDTIRFDGAALYVNGQEKTEAVSTREISGPRGEALLLRTEVLDAAPYVVADDSGRDSQLGKPFVVEADRYFVSGDNRDHSNDSRYWGTVHRDDIVGRATKLYWSWDFNGLWTDLLNPVIWRPLLTDGIRWDRIGKAVE
jgi:signal peptidase I